MQKYYLVCSDGFMNSPIYKAYSQNDKWFHFIMVRMKHKLGGLVLPYDRRLPLKILRLCNCLGFLGNLGSRKRKLIS